MDRLALKAEERELLGKKVKTLRRDGFIPGHVFGNNIETEHVSVKLNDFLPVFKKAGETGLIDLRIGAEKVRPVMIKGAQFDPVKGRILHVDFYQVNLKEKVTVPVPLILLELEEEIESVKLGEVVILQVLAEVEVEALPTDLVDHIEINMDSLKNVDDAITVGMLNYDHSKLNVLVDPEEVVVKLAPAVTEEMKALLEEQEAEAAAVAEATEGEEGVEEKKGEEGEGEEGESGEVSEDEEAKEKGEEEKKEE